MNLHLDAIWFERFLDASKDVVDTEWLQKFTKISASEQARFYEDQIENPAIHCKDVAHVTGGTALRTLRDEIEATETNDAIRDLYIRKIDNQLLRYEMLTATIDGNDEVFTEKSQALYGKPKKKYFAYIAKRMQELTNGNIAPKQAAAAKSLQSIFSKIDTEAAVTSNDVLPEPVIDTAGALKAAEVREIFLETLSEYEINDWEVRIDTDGQRPRFAVAPGDRVVHVPNDERLQRRRLPLTKTGVLALAEHELGVHVRRFHNGSRQPLLLLRQGLDNYLRGEEGVASYVQQQIEGATEYYGLDRYLAISLAIGLDGEPRDFRSLYSIMFDFYTLTLDADASKQLRHNAAWDVCTRVFRGSTGQGVGTVFTRDLAYFEGNIGIWELLVREPERYGDFFIGKYNPLLKRHVEALQSLAILPH